MKYKVGSHRGSRYEVRGENPIPCPFLTGQAPVNGEGVEKEKSGIGLSDTKRDISSCRFFSSSGRA
ncbi:hypothetical protein IT157_00280 [bacterium]|nr:hypothetical protein [bacterium]